MENEFLIHESAADRIRSRPLAAQPDNLAAMHGVHRGRMRGGEVPFRGDEWPAACAEFLIALATFLIPGLVCGGIGILRGKFRFWLTYAIALDLLILGLVWSATVPAS